MSKEMDRMLDLLEGKYFYSEIYGSLVAFKGGKIVQLEEHELIAEPTTAQYNSLIREALGKLFKTDGNDKVTDQVLDEYITRL